jgi:hypothetical protein
MSGLQEGCKEILQLAAGCIIILALISRISQPFSSVLLSQQISQRYFLSRFISQTNK